MDSIQEDTASRQPATAVVAQVVLSSSNGTWLALTSSPTSVLLERIRTCPEALPAGISMPVLVSELAPVALSSLSHAELTAIVPFLNQGFIPLDVLQNAGAVVFTIPFDLILGRGVRRAARRRRDRAS